LYRYTVLWEGEGVVTVGFDAKVLSSDYGSMRVKLSPTANMDCAATLAAYCGDNGFWLDVVQVNPA
jgi:hypothetical protein